MRKIIRKAGIITKDTATTLGGLVCAAIIGAGGAYANGGIPDYRVAIAAGAVSAAGWYLKRGDNSPVVK